MRWHTKPRPRNGDTRVIRRFAWWPVKMSDTQVVWLEWYIVEQYFLKGDWEFPDRWYDRAYIYEKKP